MGLMLIQLFVFLALSVFWIWMLVDCLQSQSFEGNDKLVWVLALIFLSVVGAVLYYLLVKKKIMGRL